MSSGGGSSSAIQALPAGSWNRPTNDLRGFVKTGAGATSKDNPDGRLDATKSTVQNTVQINNETGKYEARRNPGMSDADYQAAQANADDINRRKAGTSQSQNFVNVGATGAKTVLGG